MAILVAGVEVGCCVVSYRYREEKDESSWNADKEEAESIRNAGSSSQNWFKGMRVAPQLLLIACQAVGVVLAVLQPCDAQEAERPKAGGALRYDEDWSLLRDLPNREGQWWEPFKFIPLDDRGDVYLTLGSEFRARYEYLGHPNWGEEQTDSGGYLWLRALPTADLHLGEHARLFGELIIAPAAGVDPAPSPIDEDIADILQAFGELGVSETTRLRAGRQILIFGSGRLISTRYGTNIIRSFDTLQILTSDEKASVFAIYARPVDTKIGSFDDRWSRTQQMWSVYGTLDLVDAGILSTDSAGADLYYIGFEDEEAVFDQGSGRELRHTVGLRFFGKEDRWDWNHELFLQLGRFADDSILAWSIATSTGYTAEELPFSPRFSANFDVISGDGDRNDGKLGTFNPLFPSLKYFGEPAVIAPYNLIDFHPSVEFNVTDRLAVSGDIDFFWRYSTDDGLYGAGGQLLRSGAGSNARYIATQFELIAEYEVTENLAVSASWALMPAGPFIRETGRSDTIHFVGLEALLVY